MFQHAIKFLFLAITAYFVTSCATTEEIWIDPDGSVRTETTIDLSRFHSLELNLTTSNQEPLTASSDQLPDTGKDVELAKQEVIQNIFAEDDVDTVIYLGDLLRLTFDNSNISETAYTAYEGQASSLMNAELHIRKNSKTGENVIILRQKFQDAHSFNSEPGFFNLFDGSFQFDGTNQDEALPMMNQLIAANGSSYDLQEKMLFIRRPGLNAKTFPKQTRRSLQMMQSVMGGPQNHRIIVHFPEAVKNVSDNRAHISGNQVTLDIPGQNLGRKNKDYEVQVQLQ